ncbi:MAG TPA: hypothetical protein VK470_05465 [Bacteroidota bacterium]|nr:hypothetical protein [Bacteroidota bacterium]
MYYFCTYFDKNYYSRARALYESLRRQKTSFVLYALCLDGESERRVRALGFDNFIPIGLSELESSDPELAQSKTTRSKVEFYFTCTAALCRFVMERFTAVALLTYLDADLYFFAHPEPIFRELEGASIGIIPHRYSLLASVHKRHGIYNVGWVSFRRDEEGLACIHRWREQCIEWCYDRVEDGKFADQKYLEQWPERFTRVRVIAHKGANVGSWNIANDVMREVQGRLYVGDVPLIFFHFACFSQITPQLFNTSFAGNYAFLSRTVRRRIYLPYIEELLGYTDGGSLAPRDRQADSHIRRFYQVILQILRIVRGLIFREYIVLPRDRFPEADLHTPGKIFYLPHVEGRNDGYSEHHGR